ncbi:DUF6625 family protein [Nostoc sp.]|uniref:DUF6625 family protein n=1 Tax=Nostoc sp. TaxID=1180 RepID=UPI002FF97843
MNRIAFVIFYAGPLPDYFRFFSESVSRNKDVDVYVFNDHLSKQDISGNLKLIPLTLEQFNRLASSKLNITINITRGYKLCDLRPAYGLIFQDYLKNYDFWGYCDLDVIWSNVSHFITEDLLSIYDVITASEKFIAGHFTLFRNNEVTQNLFRQLEDYKKVFADSELYYGFDESGGKWEGNIYTLEYLQQTNQTASIYDIIMNLKEEYQLKVWMKDLSRDYPQFNLVYRNGLFTDLNSKSEFMYFHLVQAKYFWMFHFYIPPINHLPSEYCIVSGGIIPYPQNNKVARFKWRIDRLLFITKYYYRRYREIGFYAAIGKLVNKLSVTYQ